MIPNLVPVNTPYGPGKVVDPNLHGYVAVELPGQFTWMLCDESLIEVTGDRPAWTRLTPPPVMVWDQTHEVYGHVVNDYEDGLR